MNIDKIKEDSYKSFEDTLKSGNLMKIFAGGFQYDYVVAQRVFNNIYDESYLAGRNDALEDVIKKLQTDLTE